jgi:hypothetical protein
MQQFRYITNLLYNGSFIVNPTGLICLQPDLAAHDTIQEIRLMGESWL